MTEPREISKNPAFELAYWFVTVYLDKPWTDTHYKGMSLRQAKELIETYGMKTVHGCLVAYKAGRLGYTPFPLQSLNQIKSGEPPWIERYKELAKTPPPIYETASYAQWQAEFGQPAEQPTQEEPLCLSPVYPPKMPPSSGRLRTKAAPRRSPSSASRPSG